MGGIWQIIMTMQYLLVDNGSLRPDSVLNLRRLAAELGDATGKEVLPASLLHSSKVDPAELNGEAAVNLERRIRFSLEEGIREFSIIPFFLGPSGAIVDYLPQRLAYRREKHGAFHVERSPFLFLEGPGENADLVKILVDHIGGAMACRGWTRPRVALVDHGSPLPAVTRVRDALASELASVLGDRVETVAAASMERRPGPEYAFNDPLLEDLLEQPGWNTGQVVVAMLFLSPGRHAGKDGDIARICRLAEERHPGLETCMTALMGQHPGIIPVLQRRMELPAVTL